MFKLTNPFPEITPGVWQRT